MSGGIFISYRRADSAGYAGRIYDRLVSKWERERVFYDVYTIEPGLDFVKVLSDRVGDCDALVAIIGRNWLSIRDEKDRRRLDDPLDFVRIEIEAALAREIRVIPVLVDGARMPRPEDLPEGMKPLTRRSGIEISHTRFDFDAERLTKALGFIEFIEEERRKRDAAETERIAREEREKREAAEAARKAEEERSRREAAEAARKAEAERRTREAEEAERIALEERERKEAAETARQAEEERSKRDAAQAERVRREEHEKWEAAEAARQAEEERRRRDAEQAERVAREEREKKGTAEAARQADAERRKRDAAEAERIAREEREKREAAEAARKTEEERCKRDEAEAERIARLEQGSPGLALGRPKRLANRRALGLLVAFVVAVMGLILWPEVRPGDGPGAGDAQAQNSMGDRYVYGWGGVTQDYAEAMACYRKAADQGYAEAERNIGWLYENGLGVKPDYAQAAILILGFGRIIQEICCVLGRVPILRFGGLSQ